MVISTANLSFRPLSPDEARAVALWRYEAPYDFYDTHFDNLDEEAARMMKSGYFGARNQFGELVAFRCFGKDARVPGYSYDNTAIDTGGGLHPDYTGRGLGLGVIEAGLMFGRTLFENVDFRITVAAFNQRAQRVLERAGFKSDARFVARSGIEFLVLRRSV